MITTKIATGMALLFAGSLYLHSEFSLYTISKKNYQTVTKVQQQKTPLQKRIANGKEIYTDFCMQCHRADGTGTPGTIPPLNNSDWLKKKRVQSIHSVKFGQSGEITVNGVKYNNTMPPMGLSNQEVADVMNYVMNSWSNKTTKMVTVTEVANMVK